MQPFNKYYPKDWDPSKGSVNKFVGKHPLGDRARKLDKGILIVRFELPFNIWCDGCGNHIGMGVRYNAEKKKIGMYFSTPIWQFRMKCHLCDNWMEIHTDPKNAKYNVISGARQKNEEWEPEDTEVIQLKDDETAERLASDAFFALEHKTNDERKGEKAVTVLTQLQRLNDAQWSDPYTNSQRLRKKFREEKRAAAEVQRQANEIRDRGSLHIELLPESAEDEVAAKIVEFVDPSQSAQEKRKLETITSSIFSKRAKTSSGSALSSNDTVKPLAVRELGSKVLLNTKLRTDPFLVDGGFSRPAGKGIGLAEEGSLVKLKRNDKDKKPEEVISLNKRGGKDKAEAGNVSLLTVAYSSDEGDEEG